MTTPIIITNSANITVGETGPDTLENLIAHVLTWESCEDADGEAQNPCCYTDFDGWVWVTIPAQHEDGCCDAVVGSAAGVFLYAAAEFAVNEHTDAVELSGGFHFGEECLHGIAPLLHQVGMGAGLVGVGVEAAAREVVGAGRHVAADELRDHLQLFGEAGGGEVGLRFDLLENGLNLL